MGNSIVILDHLEKLTLSSKDVAAYGNELYSLRYLSQGLRFLYKTVKETEEVVCSSLDKNFDYFFGGNDEALRGIHQGLIACAFHWYAVTVCNYVRMVGWLAYGQDTRRAGNYLKQVVPPVKLWRDKIGAHFARHSPKDENAADLAMSVMFPLSFERDAFYVGSSTLTIGSGSKSYTSRRNMRWSLTHTHYDLIPRYWPTSTNEQV